MGDIICQHVLLGQDKVLRTLEPTECNLGILNEIVLLMHKGGACIHIYIAAGVLSGPIIDLRWRLTMALETVVQIV